MLGSKDRSYGNVEPITVYIRMKITRADKVIK